MRTEARNVRSDGTVGRERRFLKKRLTSANFRRRRQFAEKTLVYAFVRVACREWNTIRILHNR